MGAKTFSDLTTPMTLRELVEEALKANVYGSSDYGSPQRTTQALLDHWRDLGTLQARQSFVALLVQDFGIDSRAMLQAVKPWQADNTGAASSERQYAEVGLDLAAAELRTACLPRWHHLLLPLSRLPDGVQAVLDMRAAALQGARDTQSAQGAQLMRVFDRHLNAVLQEWFAPWLLQIQRLKWEEAPQQLLLNIAAREAVLSDKSVDGMKQRCGPGRRVFVLSHRCLPELPLVILNVALRPEVPCVLADIIEKRGDVSETAAQVACFYSISSTQAGLSGINLARHLILEAAERILSSHPTVSVLVTLSPIPSFARWLQSLWTQGEASQQVLQQVAAREGQAIASLLQIHDTDGETWQEKVRNCVDKRLWLEQQQIEDAVAPILMCLCEHYLMAGNTVDPVARFHFSNGAQLHRLNWRADMSERGLSQSLGLMANYQYELASLHENRSRFLKRQAVVGNNNAAQNLLVGNPVRRNRSIGSPQISKL